MSCRITGISVLARKKIESEIHDVGMGKAMDVDVKGRQG